MALLLVTVACGGGGGGSTADADPASTAPPIPGVVTERTLTRNHVQGPIVYQGKHPPSGGAHNPTPLTCGYYDKQPPDEFAVHSLEHGAVWIAYDPSLSSADV